GAWCRAARAFRDGPRSRDVVGALATQIGRDVGVTAGVQRDRGERYVVRLRYECAVVEVVDRQNIRGSLDAVDGGADSVGGPELDLVTRDSSALADYRTRSGVHDQVAGRRNAICADRDVVSCTRPEEGEISTTALDRMVDADGHGAAEYGRIRGADD